MLQGRRIIKMGVLTLMILCGLGCYAQINPLFNLQCIQYAELHCQEIKNEIDKYILPVFEKNKGNKDFDRITVFVKPKESKGSYSIVVRLYRDVYWEEKNNSEKSKLYATKYKGLRIIINCPPGCPLVKPINGRSICFNYVNDDAPEDIQIKYHYYKYIGINDNFIEWAYLLDEKGLSFSSVFNWCDWYRGMDKKDYVPWVKENWPQRMHEDIGGSGLLPPKKVLPPRTLN